MDQNTSMDKPFFKDRIRLKIAILAISLFSLVIFLLPDRLLKDQIILLLALPIGLVIGIYYVDRRVKPLGVNIIEKVDVIKGVLEIIAILSAGMYFYYQLLGNSEVANLSLKIDTQRLAADSTHDYLAITLTINKGDVHASYLHEIMGRVFIDQNEKPLQVDFKGYDRIQVKEDKIEFNGWNSNPKLKYQLAPEEETQFSSYLRVPKNKVCVVEVAVLSVSKTLQEIDSQWRASVVSMPE